MTLQITAPYVALMAIYAIVLGAMVSLERAKTKISMLHGDNMTLAVKMRRHGNFAETVPLVLLLMIIAEIQGLGAIWLHISGVLLIISRILHPLGLKHDDPANVMRGMGSGGTTLAMLIPIIYILWNWIAG